MVGPGKYILRYRFTLRYLQCRVLRESTIFNRISWYPSYQNNVALVNVRYVAAFLNYDAGGFMSE